MFLEFLYFTFGIALLIFGGKWLVEGASTLAKWLKVSSLVVGLVIVSIGTSAPELVVNIRSALLGSTELALGNIVGSNIANILLILGISAIITPIGLDQNTRRRDLPYLLLATIIIIVFISDVYLDGAVQNALTRVESFALVGFFMIFLAYIYFSSAAKGVNEVVEEVPRNTILKSLALVPLGVGLLALGGELTVKSAVGIARHFDVGERIIGLTIVAIGTSLPELVTSVVAAVRGKVEILIGNIIGSNIFNIFFILGVTGLISPLWLQVGIPTLDFAFMLGAVVLTILSLFIGERHKIERTQGVLMLVSYFAYLFLVIVSR